MGIFNSQGQDFDRITTLINILDQQGLILQEHLRKIDNLQKENQLLAEKIELIMNHLDVKEILLTKFIPGSGEGHIIKTESILVKIERCEHCKQELKNESLRN